MNKSQILECIILGPSQQYPRLTSSYLTSERSISESDEDENAQAGFPNCFTDDSIMENAWMLDCKLMTYLCPSNFNAKIGNSNDFPRSLPVSALTNLKSESVAATSVISGCSQSGLCDAHLPYGH
jgi:hypothetical protein